MENLESYKKEKIPTLSRTTTLNGYILLDIFIGALVIIIVSIMCDTDFQYSTYLKTLTEYSVNGYNVVAVDYDWFAPTGKLAFLSRFVNPFDYSYNPFYSNAVVDITKLPIIGGLFENPFGQFIMGTIHNISMFVAWLFVW